MKGEAGMGGTVVSKYRMGQVKSVWLVIECVIDIRLWFGGGCLFATVSLNSRSQSYSKYNQW